jgi:hypothetical protein
VRAVGLLPGRQAVSHSLIGAWFDGQRDGQRAAAVPQWRCSFRSVRIDCHVGLCFNTAVIQDGARRAGDHSLEHRP